MSEVFDNVGDFLDNLIRSCGALEIRIARGIPEKESYAAGELANAQYEVVASVPIMICNVDGGGFSIGPAEDLNYEFKNQSIFVIVYRNKHTNSIMATKSRLLIGQLGDKINIPKGGRPFNLSKFEEPKESTDRFSNIRKNVGGLGKS